VESSLARAIGVFPKAGSRRKTSSTYWQKKPAVPTELASQPLSGAAWCRPSGLASSAVACAAVSPLSVVAIRASTVLRRSRACPGSASGSYRDGFSTMPASVAAWVTVSFDAVVPK
jgi:hypothetical protein